MPTRDRRARDRADDHLPPGSVKKNVGLAFAVVACVASGVFLKLTSEDSKFVDGLFSAFMFAAIGFAVPMQVKGLVSIVGPYIPTFRGTAATRAVDATEKAAVSSRKAATAVRAAVDESEEVKP